MVTGLQPLCYPHPCCCRSSDTSRAHCIPSWMLSSYTFMCITNVVLFRSTTDPEPSALLHVPIFSDTWSAHHSLSPGATERSKTLEKGPLLSPLAEVIRLVGWEAAHGIRPRPIQLYLACSDSIPPPTRALTHDGQGSGLAQLAPHGVDDLQFTAIQIATVDRVVPRTDPVEFALREVDGQAWKKTGGSESWSPGPCGSGTRCSESRHQDGSWKGPRAPERH